MLKKITLILGFAVLSACSGLNSIPEGKLVPMKEIVADLKARPYECFEYNASTDSCKAIAKRTRKGNRMLVDADFQERLDGDMVGVKVLVEFDIRQTTFCGDMRKARVELDAPDLPEDVLAVGTGAAKREIAKMGFICNAYLRGTDGQFYSVTLDDEGRIDGSADRIDFFRMPKPLSN